MLNLFLFITISILLVLIILIATYFINKSTDDYEKRSAYECGFEPFGDARSFFDIQFYVVGILFIIFDLEIVFLIPFVMEINKTSVFAVVNFTYFMLILVLGLLYEYKKGLLNWIPTQVVAK